MDELRVYCTGANSPFRPLYFFYHWMTLLEKRGIKILTTTKTTLYPMDILVWKKFERIKTFKKEYHFPNEKNRANFMLNLK